MKNLSIIYSGGLKNKLANDLKEYGNSYSFRNLKYMSQFAKEFNYNEIRQQPVAQIPWGTLMTVIISKSKSHEETLYYINETHKNGCYGN